MDLNLPSGGSKTVPRPHPFRGGTGGGTRHDLYRDSPPPSHAVPATLPCSSPPAVAQTSAETPPRPTGVGIHNATMPITAASPLRSVAATPKATVLSGAAQPPPVTVVASPPATVDSGATVTSSHSVQVDSMPAGGQSPDDQEPMDVDDNIQPLEQVRRSSRAHVLSTRRVAANNIGADNIGRKPRK